MGVEGECSILCGKEMGRTDQGGLAVGGLI